MSHTSIKCMQHNEAMPTKKRKKEDLVQAGKTAGQTKLSFAIKSKTIDEVVS